MDDLNKLKADIKELARKLEYGEAHIDETAENLHDLANSIPTHAAEPAPVAVEGAPAEVWITNLLHPTRECVVLDQCEIPDPARGDVAYVRKDLAPTDNTALVEADHEMIARVCKAQPKLTMAGDEGSYRHDDIARLLQLIRPAALSQPAAPQPTPEVDELEERIRYILVNFDDGHAKSDVDTALASILALARGSVAEKGER